MTWETVIGLEVHVQLATQSKIFSGSSTEFGADPNTQACAIDLAMPGTLPVLNEEALRYAVMFGLAMNAEINTTSVFERKNYFYPDLPKGYQTTQLAQPIVGAGAIDITLADGSTKTIRLHHAHLEEDAGKSLHEDFHGMSGIDLNRAGTPLIEIVSEPDMRSAEEAVAYARKLHGIVTTLGICDGEMAQGSMRFDVNISVRRKGEPLGTRTETKNLNSFRFMEEAIALEVERQIDLIEDGGKVKQETRLYNGDTKTARSMRSKEDANDYRYFPCPDLLPVQIDQAYIDAVRSRLPELPDARKQRFVAAYGLSNYDAGVLSATRAMADYFEVVLNTCGDAKLAANWVLGEVSAQLNRSNLEMYQCPVSAVVLGEILRGLKEGRINQNGAKTLFREHWARATVITGNQNVTLDPVTQTATATVTVTGSGNLTLEAIKADGRGIVDALIKELKLEQVSDAGAIEKIVDDILEANPQQVDNYRAAAADKRPKMLGFFVGQIMKASKGQANPGLVNELLLKKLEG